MRLLEITRDADNASPEAAKPPPSPRPATAPRKAAHPATARRRPSPAGPAVRRSPARSPVDLEALQGRIEALERRVLAQSGRIERRATTRDLEKLHERLQRLEGHLEGELWAARQREHTLLELLSKPSLKTRLRQRGRRFLDSDLPALLRWTRRAGAGWWRDSQPEWWPRLAAAWQEALAQARR